MQGKHSFASLESEEFKESGPLKTTKSYTHSSSDGQVLWRTTVERADHQNYWQSSNRKFFGLWILVAVPQYLFSFLKVSRKDVSNLFLIHYEIVEALMRKWISLNSERSLELKYECNGLHEKGFYLFQVSDIYCKNLVWFNNTFLDCYGKGERKVDSERISVGDSQYCITKRIEKVFQHWYQQYFNVG